MQPQDHDSIYKFRNENISGQLEEPKYNSVKYGRNSLRHSSTLLWNNFKKKFPITDFRSLSRGDFKNIITTSYMDGYKNTDME